VRDFTVTDSGYAPISFEHYGNDHVGLLLDNVRLSHVVPDPPEDPDVTPVPEPGTWALLGAGLGILAWRRGKKG
jgi:hypothetical protein